MISTKIKVETLQAFSKFVQKYQAIVNNGLVLKWMNSPRLDILIKILIDSEGVTSGLAHNIQ